MPTYDISDIIWQISPNTYLQEWLNPAIFFMTSLLIILYTNLPHPTALSFMAQFHYSKHQIQLQTLEFTIFGIDCLPVVLVDFDGLYEILDLS